MPDTVARLAARVVQLARALWGRQRSIGEMPLAVTGDWVAVAAQCPSPLLEMYRDILSQHGIPAVVIDGGVGRGAMGGAPGSGALRVPAGYVEAARALLRDGNAQDVGEGDGDAGRDEDIPASERIVNRSE